MKVIKAGKLPKSKIWEGECDHCQCRIEADDTEVRTYGNDYGRLACPTANCNTWIIVTVKVTRSAE